MKGPDHAAKRLRIIVRRPWIRRPKNLHPQHLTIAPRVASVPSVANPVARATQPTLPGDERMNVRTGEREKGRIRDSSVRPAKVRLRPARAGLRLWRARNDEVRGIRPKDAEPAPPGQKQAINGERGPWVEPTVEPGSRVVNTWDLTEGLRDDTSVGKASLAARRPKLHDDGMFQHGRRDHGVPG